MRVARVVVHPEYRGLGLTKILLKIAKTFSNERWQVQGMRPIFLEISAEMLNYIDFVTSSGFHLVGKTEGNLARVAKDLVHMSKGYDVSSGIMSFKKDTFRRFRLFVVVPALQSTRSYLEFDTISRQEDPLEAMTPTEWLGLRPALRFPIPYYLCGLDEPTAAFLQTHVAPTLGNTKVSRHRSSARIDFQDIKVSSNYALPQTKNVRLILHCFGIKSTCLRQTIVGPMSLQASSGNIIFISGSSGTGKSVLLRALDPDLRHSDPDLTYQVVGSRDYSASWICALPEDMPIFDVFAERHTAGNALSALSQVGLSEALVFVKPFRLLSRGQRYRAMLADLLLRNDPVWLIDEFCATSIRWLRELSPIIFGRTSSELGALPLWLLQIIHIFWMRLGRRG